MANVRHPGNLQDPSGSCFPASGVPSDQLASPVDVDNGCLCGTASLNDVVCRAGRTEYRLVNGSEVNVTVHGWDTRTGDYSAQLNDTGSAWSFQYEIYCIDNCGNELGPYGPATVNGNAILTTGNFGVVTDGTLIGNGTIGNELGWDCTAWGFNVNAGTTSVATDNSLGSGSIDLCGTDNLHIWSSNDTIGISVSDGSAIVDLRTISIVDNGNGSYNVFDKDGNLDFTILGPGSYTQVTVNGDNSLLFTYPDGGTVNWQESVPRDIYLSATTLNNDILSLIMIDGTVHSIDLSAVLDDNYLTSATAVGTELTLGMLDGTTHTVDLTAIIAATETDTPITETGPAAYSYTSEAGTTTTWDQTPSTDGFQVLTTGTDGKPYLSEAIITSIVNNNIDGSETSITAGSNVTITGTGTTADPYVVNSVVRASSIADRAAGGYTHSDGNITTKDMYFNLALSGSDLSIVDSAGTTINTVTLSTGTGNTSSVVDRSGGGYVHSDGAGSTKDMWFTLSLSGDSLSITDGTGAVINTVNLNSLGFDCTALGTCSIANIGDVNTNGAVNGSVLKYDGSNWIVGTDDNGSTQTVITGGTNVTVSGTGDVTDPYIISSTGSTGAVSVLTNNFDGTYTHNDGTGGFSVIDICGSLTQGGCRPSVTAAGTTYTFDDGVGNRVSWNSVSGTGGDNWGTQVVISDSSLTGDGTSGSPLSVNLDGSETVVQATGDLSISGTGTSTDPYIINYVDATSGSHSVLGVNEASGTITHTSGNGTVTAIQICDLIGACSIDAVSDVDTSTTAPTTGQILVWDGSNWVPGSASAGSETVTTLTNTVTGHQIGTYNNEAGLATVLNETVTSINYTAPNLNYVDENGTTTSVDVESIISNTLTSGGDVIYTFMSNLLPNTNNRIATYRAEGAADIFDIYETTTSYNNLQGATGNKIGDYTNEAGATSDVRETITSLIDHGDGTFTYFAEDGGSVTVNTGGSETITTLVDNGNNSYTYTSEDGTTTTITGSGETITTLVDNGNGFTYTSEDGTVTTITNSGETVTTLVDNGNNSFTYTSEDNTVTTFTATETVTTLVDNGNNSFTYTSEDGTGTTVSVAGITSVVTPSVTGQTIATHDDGDGTVQNIQETVTTLVDNLNGTYQYTSEDGTATTITAGNTSVVTPVVTGQVIATHNDGAGTTQNIQETVTTLSNNGDGTYTYTSENNATTTIDTNVTETTTTVTNTVAGNQIATYNNEAGTATSINETVTSFGEAGGVLTYTDEAGNSTQVDLCTILSACGIVSRDSFATTPSDGGSTAINAAGNFTPGANCTPVTYSLVSWSTDTLDSASLDNEGLLTVSAAAGVVPEQDTAVVVVQACCPSTMCGTTSITITFTP